MGDLISYFNLSHTALGNLTSAVQFGFIIGTLGFALLTIADRFSPSKVFFISALLGAACNLGLLWEENSLHSILLFRFLTGFFLAGIYPVGMKIAADYYDKNLGRSLGFLVGALVLGTASPHLLKNLTQQMEWSMVLLYISSMAVTGGLLMLFLVPNGPFRASGQKIQLLAFYKVFNNKNFRSPAFGYFGHMWELYAFWTFVPVMLQTYGRMHPEIELNTSLWSFFIIGIGGLACIIGGYISQLIGAKKTAFTSLLLSGICCLTAPLLFKIEDLPVFLAFLLFWGMVVIADSPMFSTLVAQNADPKIKGTALTIVNCIGFAITILSIQLLSVLTDWTDSPFIYMLLVLGPAMGLVVFRRPPQTGYD